MIRVGKHKIDKVVLFLGFPWILLCLMVFLFSPSFGVFIGWAAPALMIWTFRDVFFARADERQ